jgi:hypothetical protein
MKSRSPFCHHNGAMARRRNNRPGGRPGGSEPRSFSIGAHWRADGAPKTSYSSQGEALSVADEKRMEDDVELKVYRCDYCSGWHLANAAGRDR